MSVVHVWSGPQKRGKSEEKQDDHGRFGHNITC